MRSSSPRLIPCSIALAGALMVTQLPARPLHAPAMGPSATELLTEVGLLSAAELGRVERGDVVVRVLRPTAGHEVALAGAVRLGCSAADFLDLAWTMERSGGAAGVLQAGTFGAPPGVEDVATLRLDDTEFAALQRCARGDCSSKLAVFALEAFRTYDWSAPGARARAEDLVRAGLARYVRDYAARGDAALMVFDRTRVPTSLAEEYRGVLAAASPVLGLVPELTAHLERYPAHELPASRSALRWSRGTFGLKPVIGAFHVVEYRPPSFPGVALVVSKQLYASRYFDLTLELDLVVDDTIAGRQGSWLFYSARSRVDSLRGAFAGMRRGAVEREARDAATRLLTSLRSRVGGAK